MALGMVLLQGPRGGGGPYERGAPAWAKKTHGGSSVRAKVHGGFLRRTDDGECKVGTEFLANRDTHRP